MLEISEGCPFIMDDESIDDNNGFTVEEGAVVDGGGIGAPVAAGGVEGIASKEAGVEGGKGCVADGAGVEDKGEAGVLVGVGLAGVEGVEDEVPITLS